jgi:hypothetical protein
MNYHFTAQIKTLNYVSEMPHNVFHELYTEYTHIGTCMGNGCL